MSSYVFLLESDDIGTPSRAIMSCDDQGLGDLLSKFWQMSDGRISRVSVSSLSGFECINVEDIAFKCAESSMSTCSLGQIVLAGDGDMFRTFADRVEKLMQCPTGHQYLDSENAIPNFEIIVSKREYSNDFIDRLRKSARH